jgi:hypothetical protein
LSAPAADLTVARHDRANRGQWLKWTVYILLLCNGVFYTVEEFQMASHTLRHGGDFFQWTEAFATSIDNFAWYGLLFAFELETYALEDDTFEKRWVPWALHGVRLVCYVMLAHTVAARISALDQAWTAPARPDIANLCELADQDMSWGYNFDYADITSSNCADFTNDTSFYMLEETVITDSAGWTMEKEQTVVDLVDALAWLLVIWSIELAVWLQNRNIGGGPVMLATFAAKGFYVVLFCNAGWWIYTGHYVYAWDQTLWILGFWAIERNMSEWRHDIRERARRAAPAMTH